MTADIRIGTSGWRYGPWRGEFYPKGLPQRRELAYLSHQFNTAELNGSFYSLQRPERYRNWFADTPDDFLFAVKGGRFITHMKQLRDVHTPLANFFASGVLALEHKLGPFLWQLPPRLAFDADRLTSFFEALPRTTKAAAKLARDHDEKLKGEAHTSAGKSGAERSVEGGGGRRAGKGRTLRHALEVRHPSFTSKEAVDLLRKHEIGLVVADSAGNWPQLEDVTADFVYVRLHGDEELYASGYSEKVLKQWARKIRAWHKKRLDVYVYFDNDIKVKAPGDATKLGELLGLDLTTELEPE